VSGTSAIAVVLLVVVLLLFHLLVLESAVCICLLYNYAFASLVIKVVVWLVPWNYNPNRAYNEFYIYLGIRFQMVNFQPTHPVDVFVVTVELGFSATQFE
jgi:hypothetical protein